MIHRTAPSIAAVESLLGILYRLDKNCKARVCSINRPSADVESVMSNVLLCVLQHCVVASSLLVDVEWTTERGDPHGRISERGCVVDSETVALDEWLIITTVLRR